VTETQRPCCINPEMRRTCTHIPSNASAALPVRARRQPRTGAIEAANSAGAAALNVLGSLLLYSNRKIIFKSVATLSLPAIYQSPEMAEEDGFIA
jgi:hypothetical protein